MTRTSPNKMDRILESVFLWFIPRFVTPNHITTLRLISIPFVIYFFLIKNYAVGLPLFVISAFTDALDGAMARTRNKITEWGTLFDPIADKLLIAAAVMVLIFNEVSFVLAMLILLIDVSILFVVAYNYNRHKKILSPHWTGKTKMFLQSSGIGLYLIYTLIPFAFITWLAIGTLYLAVLFGLVSLIIYKSA